MKLFTPTKSKEINTTKRDEDISSIAYLEVTLKKLQDSINIENKNFSNRLEEQRILYTEEKSKLQQELLNIQSQIEIGERRLKQLMIPVDGLKEEAEKIVIELKEKERIVNEKIVELEEDEEDMQIAKDLLIEKELRITELEMKSETKLKGIEEEKKMVSDSHAKLNAEILSFRQQQLQRTKELDEREKVLTIKEKMNQEYILSRTKELDNEKRSLTDRREALEREFSRLSNNKK